MVGIHMSVNHGHYPQAVTELQADLMYCMGGQPPLRKGLDEMDGGNGITAGGAGLAGAPVKVFIAIDTLRAVYFQILFPQGYKVKQSGLRLAEYPRYKQLLFSIV